MSKKKEELFIISIKIVAGLLDKIKMSERTLSTRVGKSPQWYNTVKKRAKDGYAEIDYVVAQKMANILGNGAVQKLSDKDNRYYNPIQYEYYAKAKHYFEKLLPTHTELLADLLEFIAHDKDEQSIGRLRLLISMNLPSRWETPTPEKFWCNTLLLSELDKSLKEDSAEWSIDDIWEKYNKRKERAKKKGNVTDTEVVVRDEEKKRMLEEIVDDRWTEVESVLHDDEFQKRLIKSCAKFLFRYFETAPINVDVLDKINLYKIGVL